MNMTQLTLSDTPALHITPLTHPTQLMPIPACAGHIQDCEPNAWTDGIKMTCASVFIYPGIRGSKDVGPFFPKVCVAKVLVGFPTRRGACFAVVGLISADIDQVRPEPFGPDRLFRQQEKGGWMSGSGGTPSSVRLWPSEHTWNDTLVVTPRPGNTKH